MASNPSARVALKDRIPPSHRHRPPNRSHHRFPLFIAFIHATAAESDWAQRFRARRAGPPHSTDQHEADPRFEA